MPKRSRKNQMEKKSRTAAIAISWILVSCAPVITELIIKRER